MDATDQSLDTQVIHAGEEERIRGAVVFPIFQSSVFEIPGAWSSEARRYPRYNNLPDQQILAAKLAALEGGEAAVVTASGMGAIAGALLAVLGAGDHLLAAGTLYGGTHELVTGAFPGFGIEHDLVPGDDPDAWKAHLRPTTRVIYAEAISNPQVRVPALDEVVRFAREHGLVSMVDNTFASPVNFRPPAAGFDLSVHSGTKYLNGHSDLLAGAVIGRADLVEAVRRKAVLLGAIIDPHACFLLHRGIKTLALRVERQNANAMALAEHLADHPAVERVCYPGLPADPSHERARRLLSGFGGMLAFEPREGEQATDRFLDGVRLAIHAPSLGGVETLVLAPARATHSELSPEERRRQGIGEGMIRVSVGIESVADLIADFDQALAG